MGMPKMSGISQRSPRAARNADTRVAKLPVRIVRLFPPACAHENSGVFVTRSAGGRTREPGHAERRYPILPKVFGVLESAGLARPIICTPEELLNDDTDIS